MDPSEGDRNPVEELAEEFVERRRRGEMPTLEEYTRRFPDLAEAIRSLFPALVMMEKLAADTGDAEAFDEPGLDRPRTRSRPPLEHLGDFRILREVGRGGMGIVYEAEQESLGRRVALKVLAGHRTLDRGQVRRFEREARSAARLHHTNIVPVFGVGEEDGLHYYVMQFIQGQGLDEVLAELKRLRAVKAGQTVTGSEPRVDASVVPGLHSQAGKPDLRVAESLLSGAFRHGLSGQSDRTGVASTAIERPAVAARRCENSSSVTLPGQAELSSSSPSEQQYARSIARIGIQVAAALEYANAQGILHRDIKPSNLLLDLKGTVWVTDFGLAKASDGNDLTHTGDIVGTLRYMAPERFRGRCDARADVYSLGLTLYELLALRPAYDESDRQQLVQQVTQQEPARLRKLNPSVPRDLATIVQKAIAPEPDRRYPTADALAEDLQRFLDDKPIRARHIYLLERLVRWGRRNRMVSALSAAVLVLLLTVAVVFGVATFRLSKSLRDTQAAQADGTDKLWGSYLAQARGLRLSQRPGQRFDSLRAIQEALKLPVPKDRSLDELRDEAIACLCVTDDLAPAKEWDGRPVGTGAWAIDDAFERYARDDHHGNVSVRRIADDQELFRLPGEGGSLHEYVGLEFSRDGRFLHQRWPGGPHSRLWRLDTTPPLAMLSDDHISLAFSSDSRRFAAGYPDSSLRFYDAETAREVGRFTHILPKADALLRWNPRLPQITLLADICRVIDVESGKIQAEFSVPGGVQWMDWHPEGRVLAIAAHDLRIYLYEVAGRRPVLRPLEGHKDYGIVLRFNHAGDRLVSNDWSSILRLWDVRTGRQLLAQPAAGACLAFSRDDRRLAADVGLPKVRLFDCRTSHEFRTVVRRTAIVAGFRGSPVWASDGRLMAQRTGNGVALVDVFRGEEVATLRLSGNDYPVCFEPRDEALWTSGQSGVLRWPLHTESGGKRHLGPPQTLASSKSNCHAAASADGQLVCIPQGDEAFLWQRGSNKKSVIGPQDDVRVAAVSADGQWVATGTHTIKAGAGAKVWEGATGRHVADLPVGGLCGVRFSPDGRWLITTGGGVRIWSVGTWQEGPKLAGPQITADVAFTADSQCLALEGSLGEVRLLRTETGEELARLTAPVQTRLVPQAFTPDGTQLVTVGRETGALHIFDLASIRAQLVDLGLDWDAPPLPSSPATDVERLEVQVE